MGDEIPPKPVCTGMTRPIPTPIFHITHARHLDSIITNGLRCDRLAQAEGLAVEIGNRDLKDDRRSVPIRVAPGGFVADYAPFYYRAYGPFLSAIDHGRVPEYTEGIEPLLILQSTVEHLLEIGCTLVFTDRNALFSTAAHTNRIEDLDALVGWDVIHGRYWNDFEDGRERRMAECLVHESVPWEGFLAIATMTEARATEVAAMVALATYQGRTTHQPQVLHKSDWYH